MYALIHKTGNAEETSDISLFGTNSFHKVWEDACAKVFNSQLRVPINKLSFPLADEYKNETRSLLEIIPAPRWEHYESHRIQSATGTLIPDYISIYRSGDVSYFVIMDAKYYDIEFSPKLSGQPGVDDVDKQYLYQLSYKDFIKKHNLIPINVFLFPGETISSMVAGEVQMPVFDGFELKSIKVAILSCKRMLQAYLSDYKFDLQSELPNLLSTPK